MITTNVLYKANIVYLILSTDTEEALDLLSNHYGIIRPKLTVGMPKRYSKNHACYVANKRTIHVSRREILWNPYVILHEFYHHLRNVTDSHGGIEKYANSFAQDYLQAYQKALKFEK